MRAYRLCLFFGFGMIGWSPAALAAEEAAERGGASVAVWIMLFAPTLFVAFLLYLITRRARSQQAIFARNLERWEEHRRVTEEHMKRLEAQIDRLDARLSRIVELLETWERGQG